MNYPSLALQAACVAALKADVGLAALVGKRVYDRVPDKATYPYVSLGAEQTIPDYDQCGESPETIITFDVWSNEPGRVELKKIAARVAAVLDAPLAVEGFTITIHKIEDLRILPEAATLIPHAIVNVSYQTEPV